MNVAAAIVLAGLIAIPLALFLAFWRRCSKHRRFMDLMTKANALADTAEIYRQADMREEAKAALAEAWRLILLARAIRDGDE